MTADSLSFRRPFLLDAECPVSKSDLTVERIPEPLSVSSHPIVWRRGNLIGEGVFGKVFQAMNVDTGELLAVKVIKLSSDPSVAVKQFSVLSDEVDLLKSLNHLNITKYYQTDTHPESRSVSILLEYITGGSLRELLLRFGKFPANVIRSYTSQILRGLSYLHSQRVVHRDLKSANVLVTEDAIIKLSDFGCSKKLDRGGISMSVKGSPFWMAPEVVMETGHSYPSDIWSLGCLVLEMASGAPPWSDVSTKAAEVIRMISTPGMLPTMPDVAEDLMTIIRKCLQRDPKLRPTAKELLQHSCLTSMAITRSQSTILKKQSNTAVDRNN
jgi:mitogen-activated protein kinase kinase kinase ANP1